VLRQQTGGQGGRLVESARDRDRGLGQGSCAWSLGWHRMLQLTGQRRGHLRLGRGTTPAERLTSGVQGGDQVGAWHGEAGTHPIQPQRDRRQLVRVIAVPCA
jgi:hypothetical protein